MRHIQFLSKAIKDEKNELKAMLCKLNFVITQLHTLILPQCDTSIILVSIL